MTLDEVIETLQIWIATADDEYDREEMGRVCGLKEALHEIKKIKPCTDAISRQAVLEIQEKYAKYMGATKFWQMRDDIKASPSVPPQPKIGRWVYDERIDKHHYCSECKSMGVDYWDYCPYCGAKMQEVEE